MTVQGTGLIDPILTFVDPNGVPYASGTVTFYATGTQNLQNIYSDTALTVPLANPMTLNAAGRSSSNGTNTSPVYFQPLFYDYVLKDSTGTIIYGPETFNGSAWPGALQGTVVISPAVGASAYANRVTTTINKAASGTAALFAGTRFDATTIGANTSTLTESATVYIEGAPSAGSSAYALHVGAANGGAVRFDGVITTPSNAGVCNGRLTLTTLTPVTTGDVTGATTIFFTPYIGNTIGLFDGVSAWSVLTFSEISVALGTLTANLPYDVFAYNNSGTVALRAPVSWANTTTRTTALTLQNGILVKTGATTDRYLGTFYTDSTTQTSDSGAGSASSGRHLWNYYNRFRRPLSRIETTDTWNPTSTNAWERANNSTANQVQVVIGWAEADLDLSAHIGAYNTGASGIVATNIGEDSTTTPVPAAGGVTFTSGLASNNSPNYMSCRLVRIPAVGHHAYNWLLYAASGGTNVWVGDDGLNSNGAGNGMSGWVEG